jgi:hypothetical protein
MRPLLELHTEGRGKTHDDLLADIARHLELGEGDRDEVVFVNRVAWSMAHLKQAVLVVKPGRLSQITQRGQDVLEAYPAPFSTVVLEQFPEYLEARRRSRGLDELCYGDQAAEAVEKWRARGADPLFPVDCEGQWAPSSLAAVYRISSAAYHQSRHWKSTRRRQISLVGACELCGSQERLEIHHLHYGTLGRERPGADLQTLCSPCHRTEIHADKATSWGTWST